MTDPPHAAGSTGCSRCSGHVQDHSSRSLCVTCCDIRSGMSRPGCHLRPPTRKWGEQGRGPVAWQQQQRKTSDTQVLLRVRALAGIRLLSGSPPRTSWRGGWPHPQPPDPAQPGQRSPTALTPLNAQPPQPRRPTPAPLNEHASPWVCEHTPCTPCRPLHAHVSLNKTVCTVQPEAPHGDSPAPAPPQPWETGESGGCVRRDTGTIPGARTAPGAPVAPEAPTFKLQCEPLAGTQRPGLGGRESPVRAPCPPGRPSGPLPPTGDAAVCLRHLCSRQQAGF